MKSKRANERVTSGKIRFPLEQVGPNLVGRGELEGKRKRVKKKEEREAPHSL